MPERFLGLVHAVFYVYGLKATWAHVFSCGFVRHGFSLCEYVTHTRVVMTRMFALVVSFFYVMQPAKRHQVVIAAGSHLFPFRTEKLSPLAPMVLQCNAGE